MTPPDPTHPPEDALFDLVEGSLDAARARSIEQHLAACDECSTLVESARAGATAARGADLSMPADASHRLHLALADTWDELHATSRPLPAAPAHTTRRWSRRLVPALAFALLATIAGTSILAVDERPGGGRDAEEEVTQREDADVSTGTSADLLQPERSRDLATNEKSARSGAESGAAGTASPAVAPQEDGGGPVSAEAPGGPGGPPPAPPGTGDHAGSPGGVTATTPSTTQPGPDEAEPVPEPDPDPETCVLTFGQYRLVLPDGSVPDRVIDGPLGMFIVCG